MVRVVFMGTPDFSVPSAQALVDAGYNLVAVVTQPDRPSGRGRHMEPSPVKRFALEQGIEVLQPETLRDPLAIDALAALMPDLIVVAAFGQILRPAMLNLPRFGCINVHASLLPRWRGAAPVQAAILAGDQVTGSTIMRMDEGMDTGPILAQAALAVAPTDTGATLTARLASHGAALLVQTLPDWLAELLEPQPQDQTLVTVCRPIRKQQGRIDWRLPAVQIQRAVRAFNPWPAASTIWNGVHLKVLNAIASDAAIPGAASPGEVLIVDGDPVVVCGEGTLWLGTVQLAGRSAVAAADFLRGQPTFPGSILGAD